MPAIAVCSVCDKNEKIETTALGVALMPKTWFVTVRPKGNDFETFDVCSQDCAVTFDKQNPRPDGLKETVVEDMVDGEIVTQRFEHDEQTGREQGAKA